MKNLKHIMVVTLAIFLGRTAVLIAQKNKKSKRPNILIILTDDQGNADAGYQQAIDAAKRHGIKIPMLD